MEQFATWVASIGTALNVAFFAYIATQLRANATDRAAIQKLLLDAKDEQMKAQAARNEVERAQHEFDKHRLANALEEATAKIDKAVPKDLQSLVQDSNRTSNPVPEETQKELRETGHAMQQALVEYKVVAPAASSDIARWQEAIAKSYIASDDYAEAARQLDEAAQTDDLNWQSHLNRGIAHANRRDGKTSDLAALRAYNDAIALMPANASDTQKSRAFAYRGAMFKRLGRLEEADSDLKIALSYAADHEDRVDAYYNLACVAAMKGEVDRALGYLGHFASDAIYMEHVVRNRNRYFENLNGNATFEQLIAFAERRRALIRRTPDDIR